MRKNILLPTAILVVLLTVPLVCAQTPQPSIGIDGPWFATTGVNQPVEFTAKTIGGTAPFTFQWYYTYLDPNVDPTHWIKVAVPDATSATFQFVGTKPGRYGISISWYDANGYVGYESFQPMGLVVTVQEVAVPTPDITILTQNKTYTENNVTLNFTLSTSIDWVGYSLDGQANITLNGNTTLTALPNGPHTAVIYANDTYGNMASPQTLTFTIQTEKQIPTAYIAVLVLVVAGLVAIAALAAKIKLTPH